MGWIVEVLGFMGYGIVNSRGLKMIDLVICNGWIVWSGEWSTISAGFRGSLIFQRREERKGIVGI